MPSLGAIKQDCKQRNRMPIISFKIISGNNIILFGLDPNKSYIYVENILCQQCQSDIQLYYTT